MCTQEATKFIDAEALEVHAKANGNSRGKEDIEAVQLCGAKQNNSYCGIEHSALGTLRLQASCPF